MTALAEHPIPMLDRGWRPGELGGSPGGQRPHRGPFAEALDPPARPRILADNRGQADVTHAVIAAVAYSIWEQRGGAAPDNWREAERVVSRLFNSGAPARRRRPERIW